MSVSSKALEQRYRGKPVRRMHVMVKPTATLCDLDCSYCYYLSKQDLLGKPARWRISDTILEDYIRQLLRRAQPQGGGFLLARR